MNQNFANVAVHLSSPRIDERYLRTRDVFYYSSALP